MKRNNYKNILFLVISCHMFLLIGCETSKIVLGTSIEHLQGARLEALVQTYDCAFDKCFDAILSLARNEHAGDIKSAKEPVFDVFMKNRIKSYIVVMGIEGNINTTEVGIFLTQQEQGVKIEVSSLSSTAKRKAAEAIFEELSLRFNKI